MPRDGQQIDSQFIHINKYLSQRLGHICVHQCTTLAGKCGNLLDWLERSHFIVGMHDGNEDGRAADLAGHFLRINPASGVRADITDLEPQGFQVMAWVQDGRVFDFRRDDVVSPVSQRMGHAFDHMVIGLGAARCENNFVGSRPHQAGNLLSGPLNGLPQGRAGGMRA